MPDWTDRRDVRGLDRDAVHAAQLELTEAMDARGAVWGRVTFLPNALTPVEIVCEGWRERPLDEEPLPTMTGVAIHKHGTTVTLPCGAVIEGRPHDTDAYRATARQLGYSDDTLAMCRDHDSLHARLCDWLGVESYALREAAGIAVDAEIAAAEEAAVLAVQKFMRLAGAAVPR